MRRFRILAFLVFAFSGFLAEGNSQSQPKQQANPEKKSYTIVEAGPLYNILQEKDASKRVKLLDDFLAKSHPPAELAPYVYPSYYEAYWELKNYPKVMEYADKFIALGGGTDAALRYQALYTWCMAYNDLSSQDSELATNARLRTSAAMKVLSEIQKPQNIDDQHWEDQKKKVKIYLLATSGRAANILNDYSGIDDAFKSILELTPSTRQPDR